MNIHASTKIKLLILFFISSSLCKGQLRESDLFLEWNGKNWVNTNKNGYVVTKIIEQDLYGNNSVIKNKKTYSYNSDRQVVEVKEEELGYSDDFVPKTKETFTYNPDSKIIEEHWYYWEKTDWSEPMIKKFSFKYNAQNNCIERAELKRGNDDKWTKERGNVYKYNAAGKLIRDVFNITTIDTTVIDFKYDDIGNCIEEKQVMHHRTTKSYDASRKLTEEKTQFWENENWIDSWRWSNSYDEKNNLIESKETRWEGSQWNNSIKYVFKYDTFGNQVEKVIWHFDNGRWIAKHKTQYVLEQFVNIGAPTKKSIQFFESAIANNLIDIDGVKIQQNTDGSIIYKCVLPSNNNHGFLIQDFIDDEFSQRGYDLVENHVNNTVMDGNRILTRGNILKVYRHCDKKIIFSVTQWDVERVLELTIHYVPKKQIGHLSFCK